MSKVNQKGPRPRGQQWMGHLRLGAAGEKPAKAPVYEPLGG